LIKNEHPTGSRLGFLGISFKAGTDDVRNSPTIEIIQALSSEGYQIFVYDYDVSSAISTGRNPNLIKNILGPIVDMIVPTVHEFLLKTDVIIVAKQDNQNTEILVHQKSRPIIDLVNLSGLEGKIINYSGLAW
jgi:GDP-mannose 6-dehydrogenase